MLPKVFYNDECKICSLEINHYKKKCNLIEWKGIHKDNDTLKSIDKTNKIEVSKIVAEKLAKKAVEKKITKVYFDRGVYKYHGRVKVFAETLRKNGMEF